MTAIVEHDPVLVDLFQSALGESAIVLPSVAAVEQHLQRHPNEYALLLGPSVDDATAAALAEANRISRPALGVILVRPVVDSTVLTEALRSGMREVVETTNPAALGQAVARAHSVAQAMSRSVTGPQPVERQGRLITVFSTKGGVGKSVVATNLGAALADQGHEVCIVDLDVGCGDVAIMLQLTPQHTLADLPSIHGEIDPSGVRSLLTEHSERVTVLAAPVQLGAPVPADRVGPVLDTLKTMFDVVVVDTAGAFDDHSLQALDRTDRLVLVGTLDIPALKSLKLTVGTLDLLNMPRDHWTLVLNRADPKVGLTAAELEETLGLKADVSIPSSRDVLTAVNRGEVIVRANRGHQVSKALASFAAALAPELAHSPSHSDDQHEAPRHGGLRRLRTKG